MKLGIINGWDEQSFAYVHDKGLKYVEYCINGKYNSEDFLNGAPQVKALSEKYGVSVGSMGRWGVIRIDENGEIISSALQDDKNLIDAASLLGCPVFNCGCNYTESKTFMENCSIAVNYFKTLIDYAEGKNVKIAVYNCDWENFVVTPNEWKIVLGELPQLGLKYDTSHCIGRHNDYLAEMDEWGERIYHFHLKGSLYINGEHYDDPPAGLDQTNWGAVMNMLYTKGYNEMVSIEPHSGNWKGVRGQWGIDFTINFIKPYIMPDDYGASQNNPYMP